MGLKTRMLSRETRILQPTNIYIEGSEVKLTKNEQTLPWATSNRSQCAQS